MSYKLLSDFRILKKWKKKLFSFSDLSSFLVLALTCNFLHDFLSSSFKSFCTKYNLIVMKLAKPQHFSESFICYVLLFQFHPRKSSLTYAILFHSHVIPYLLLISFALFRSFLFITILIGCFFCHISEDDNTFIPFNCDLYYIFYFIIFTSFSNLPISFYHSSYIISKFLFLLLVFGFLSGLYNVYITRSLITFSVLAFLFSLFFACAQTSLPNEVPKILLQQI